jgi:hypothetical protein
VGELMDDEVLKGMPKTFQIFNELLEKAREEQLNKEER